MSSEKLGGPWPPWPPPLPTPCVSEFVGNLLSVELPPSDLDTIEFTYSWNFNDLALLVLRSIPEKLRSKSNLTLEL